MSARLGYLLKKFPRLSETFVLNEILAQEALGRDVHVFSRRTPDEEVRHPELARLRAGVDVLPSTRRIDPWSLLFDGGRAEEPTESHDAELFARLAKIVAANRELPHHRFPELIAEALWLLGRTRELGIGHIHAHFATDSATTAMYLHALGGPTYSITAHAKDIYRETVDWRLHERLFRGASFVVTVCDANKRYLGERLSDGATAKVVRIYNGIDVDSFAPDPGDVRKPAQILSVGRLVEKKGFAVQLDALAMLAARGVPFEAVWIGEGELAEDLRARARELGLGDRVRFLGPQDQNAVRRAMREATVFCLPCIVGDDGNRDALPTVMLEALASGLPIVSTPVTGIPEILDNGRAGVLVPESDAKATAAALEKLLGDPQARANLSRAGLERADKLFRLSTNARVLGELFDHVLEAAPERCTSSV